MHLCATSDLVHTLLLPQDILEHEQDIPDEKNRMNNTIYRGHELWFLRSF